MSVGKMRVALVAAAALVVLAGCVNESTYSGDATGPKVAIVGDDVVAASTAEIHGALDADHQVRIVAVDNATAANLQPSAATLGATHPAVAVIEVGTNDAAKAIPAATTIAGIDAARASFPTPTCRALVTVNEHVTKPGFVAAAAHQTNVAIAARGDEVVDWNAAIAADIGLYTTAPDHLVPTAAGRALLADLVAQATARCVAPARLFVGGIQIGCSHCYGPYDSRSTDGGATWTDVTTLPSIVGDAIDDDGTLISAGWLDGSADFNVNRAHVARSTDGGATWTEATTQPPVANPLVPGNLDGITRSGDRLVVVGDAVTLPFAHIGYAASSTDGGDTWVGATTLPPCSSLYDVVDGPTGLVAVGTSATGACVARSTDGGQTWTAPTTPPTGGATLSGVARQSGTLVAVGQTSGGSGYVTRSTDGGLTWTTSGAPAGATGLGAVTDGPSGLIVVGTAAGGHLLVARSTDGGGTWVLSSVPALGGGLLGVTHTRGGLLAVGLRIDPDNGAQDGLVLRSTDGGATWSPTPTQPSPPGLGGSFSAVAEAS